MKHKIKLCKKGVSAVEPAQIYSLREVSPLSPRSFLWFRFLHVHLIRSVCLWESNSTTDEIRADLRFSGHNFPKGRPSLVSWNSLRLGLEKNTHKEGRKWCNAGVGGLQAGRRDGEESNMARYKCRQADFSDKPFQKKPHSRLSGSDLYSRVLQCLRHAWQKKIAWDKNRKGKLLIARVC